MQEIYQKNLKSSSLKKILQISKYYYPEVGGIEKIAAAISDSVVDKFEMKVVCFSRAPEDRIDVVGNVEVVRCGSKTKIASQPISFKIIKELKRVLKNYKPNYIIIHEPNPYMTFFLMKCIPKTVKLIVYWHSDIVKQKLGEFILRRLYYKELKRAGAVIATSPNYINGSIYLSSVKEKCIVIPNCINEKALQISQESHRIANEVRQRHPDKIICVSIGRCVPYKGYEYLANVAKSLDDRFVFYVSGHPGKSTPVIKNMTKGLNNFILLGETSDDVQKGYLEACDIFCFPSITKNEAFGLALAEGMYFGKPAITYTIDGSGVNYVSVNRKTGIEVKNGDVEEYAIALKKLAADDELRLRLGRAAKERVENNFLSVQFHKNILEMLMKL